MSNQITTQTLSFYGSDLITLKVEDVIYTAVRPIVDALGLSWGSQQRKLENSKEKFSCTHMKTTGSDGKTYEMLCMPIKKLNGWLFSINPEKVRVDLKEKVICYQEECFEALYNYWHLGKAERLQNSAENQTALPEPTLTAEEQNMLQNAVKATHERTKLSYGEIWARTKNKFRVAEYKQIKCSDLRDALIYVASMQPACIDRPRQTINVDWFNMMNFALLLKQYHRFTKDLPHIHTYLSALPEHSAMAGLLKNHLTEMKNNDRLFTDSILSLSEISNHFLP
ncbi:phage antirepressor N-terminal domain-containing protein, partial [Mannheimia haemolytica]